MMKHKNFVGNKYKCAQSYEFFYMAVNARTFPQRVEEELRGKDVWFYRNVLGIS